MSPMPTISPLPSMSQCRRLMAPNKNSLSEQILILKALSHERKVGGKTIHFLKAFFNTYSKFMFGVRVIKILGTKDNSFSGLGDVTKNECFLIFMRGQLKFCL